jgi:hypothetical protein
MFHNVTDRTDTMSERQEAGQGLWCILLTASQRTVALADALAAAGFEAWTPRRMETRRRPRSTIYVDREVPIASRFVFVPARHLDALWRARSLPKSPFPSFSVFGVGYRVALVRDADIAALRAEEEQHARLWQALLDRREKKQKRSQRYFYARGATVSLPGQASFTGLIGVVQSGDGKSAMVDFGGGRHWKIEAWRLAPVHVEQNVPKSIAARAA